MDVLYLLIPLSVLLVFGILGVFAWALHGGQFDDLEQQGTLILAPRRDALDTGQGASRPSQEESIRRH